MEAKEIKLSTSHTTYYWSSLTYHNHHEKWSTDFLILSCTYLLNPKLNIDDDGAMAIPSCACILYGTFSLRCWESL